jgi:ABC-type Mn2+/Zn2+ transport system permease subunit
MIAGINLIHRRSRLTEDTGIGLLFVGMLAIGVMLISRTGAYAGSLTGILFGDALAVSETDIWILGVTAVVVLALNLAFHRSFLVLAFNQQKAEVLGLRPGLAHLVMLAMVTMAVVASFRTVGTLLVFGLLMAPAATATLLVRRVSAVMGMAVLLGIAAVALGLVISLYANTAGSATMAATSVGIFFVVLITRGFIRPD